MSINKKVFKNLTLALNILFLIPVVVFLYLLKTTLQFCESIWYYKKR